MQEEWFSYKYKFKTNLISNNSSLSTEILDRTNFEYMFKCPWEIWDKENNASYHYKSF